MYGKIQQHLQNELKTIEDNGIFKNLTWLRGIGATVFFVGGVSPLTWFIATRARHLKN